MGTVYSLFIGRYQPWHEGHATIMKKVLEEGKNIVIALRDTPVTSTDPLTIEERLHIIRNYWRNTSYEKRVKIIIIPDIEEVCYGRKVGWGIRKIDIDPELEKISATQIRKDIDTFQETVKKSQEEIAQTPKCLWLTGLSASGKTTIARALVETLKERGHNPVNLDGDDLRNGLCSDLGFSDRDRNENLRRAAHVAKILADSGHIVITSFISPMHSQREFARRVFETGKGLGLVEIFVLCPLSVCERRDPKGLYKKARKGLIPDFTGISAPYEIPETPDLVVDTSAMEVNQCVKKIIERFHL